jgi:transketolase
MTFSDYMRNAIRLASMMGLKLYYQFTHDSIRMGEDGPTHIPVEHLASLRAMPGLTVIRPADTNEVKAAWCWMLRHDRPVALILSRQNISDNDETQAAFGPEGLARGAYVLKKESAGRIDNVILATGSEVAVALGVAARLEGKGQPTRVVSVPSFEIFDAQGDEYRDKILGRGVRRYVSIEAQSTFGWHKYIGRDGIAIGIDEFGVSAPGPEQAEHFGFTVDKVLESIGEK